MNEPIKKFRCGQIQAAVWEKSQMVNNTVIMTYFVKIDKSYMKENKWQNTCFISVDDLPKVATLAMKIFEDIRVKSSEDPSITSSNDQSTITEQRLSE